MAALTIDPGPRRIGSSGLEVGPIGYGCWRLAEGDAREARRKIEAALDAGLTLIDTADVYGLDSGRGFGAAETLLGEVLAAAPGLRDEMVLATKGGIRPPVPYDSSASWLREACEGSLRRLQVDRVDLYQIHRPDLLAHPDEVAGVLSALRSEGKVGSVGVSNMSVSQLDALEAALGERVVTTQPELSAWHLDPVFDGTLDRCLRDDVTPLAWSPLGGGRVGDAGDRVTRVIDGIAEAQATTPTAVALAVLLVHPSRPVPIIGTQQVGRIAAATAALAVELTRSDWYRVVEASIGEPLP